MTPNFPLHLALALYGAGTLVVLAALVVRFESARLWGLGAMTAGFVSHTIWIGIICSRTGHPPLTNLPEIASFIAWTILAVKLGLWVRYRVEAAAFVTYPLVFLLLGIAAVVQERFRPLPDELQSNVFIGHLLFTAIGIAALLVGIGFAVLYQIQERALRRKERGRLWEWIPSLRVCDFVSFRAISIGFVLYTIGIVAGILWSYRSTVAILTPGVKEIGAFVAWIFFAVLLQSYIAGSYRTPRTLVIAGLAFVSIFISLLGIQHV